MIARRHGAIKLDGKDREMLQDFLLYLAQPFFLAGEANKNTLLLKKMMTAKPYPLRKKREKKTSNGPNQS